MFLYRSVGIAAGYPVTAVLASIPVMIKISPKRSRVNLVPTERKENIFLWGKAALNVNLSTHLNTLPRLKTAQNYISTHPYVFLG
jgi:hypothetical protein